MLPELEVTLVGQVNAWQARPSYALGRVVWGAWLRHPSCGTIGVYLPAPAPRSARRACDTPDLPKQSWVQVTGRLRPIRAHACPDDPRTADDPTSTPLLIRVVRLARCSPFTPPPPLPVRDLALAPGRWIGTGFLAPARHMRDLYGFTTSVLPRSAVLSWDRIAGVIATIARRRYVRYLALRAVDVPEGRVPWATLHRS